MMALITPICIPMSAGELQIIPEGGTIVQPAALNDENRHASYLLGVTTTDATITPMTLTPAVEPWDCKPIPLGFLMLMSWVK